MITVKSLTKRYGRITAVDSLATLRSRPAP